MHKIMLVEDETKVLNTILQTIKWSEHGFEIPIDCHDGREAIQKVQDGFCPQVLITDICMPFVDGLELIHYFNENLPETIIVILTGYDDFKYAQKAVQLRVFDYVLKPITPNKLYELLDRLKDTLDIIQIRSIDNPLTIISSYFLNCLLMKHLNIKYIEESCHAHKFDFYGKYHLVAVLDIDSPLPCTIEESNNLQLMRYGLYNISQEIVSNSPNGKNIVVFQASDGLTKLIIDTNSKEKCHTTSYKLMEIIVSTVSECLNITVSAGIGDPVARLDEIYQSHLQAMTALNHRFFYGESSIIFASDIDIKKPQEIDYLSYEMCLMDAIKSMDFNNAKFVISNMITSFKQNNVDFNHCVLYSQKITINLISFTDKIIGNHDLNSLEKVWGEFNFYSVSTISMLENLLLKICDKAFKLLKGIKNDSAKMQVVEAEKYIDEHLSDNTLSLNRITERLSISTGYFTTIFKEQTGLTFVEYITSLRMERAKQILSFTDKKTCEVAEEVGFSNSQYFNVAFKRATGVTPKEYRECNFKKKA